MHVLQKYENNSSLEILLQVHNDNKTLTLIEQWCKKPVNYAYMH